MPAYMNIHMPVCAFVTNRISSITTNSLLNHVYNETSTHNHVYNQTSTQYHVYIVTLTASEHTPTAFCAV